MTEPLWKRNQQLEARVRELEAEVVRLKNRNYLEDRQETVLLSNPDDIARLTIAGKSWHNYNNTFTHKNGVIYSYDVIIATVDMDTGTYHCPPGNYTKTTQRRQNEVMRSFHNYTS